MFNRVFKYIFENNNTFIYKIEINLMVFNITKKADGFVVSTNPIAYGGLDAGREAVASTFQEGGAVFEEAKWTEDKFPCSERAGYWNRLQFRQLGDYKGRRMGLFGSTSGLKETFCGPRDAGDTIMREAAIRQGVYRGGNPEYIEGRKAFRTDMGRIVIAFLLPEQVSQNARLEELFEQGVSHTDRIRALLE